MMELFEVVVVTHDKVSRRIASSFLHDKVGVLVVVVIVAAAVEDDVGDAARLGTVQRLVVNEVVLLSNTRRGRACARRSASSWAARRSTRNCYKRRNSLQN